MLVYINNMLSGQKDIGSKCKMSDQSKMLIINPVIR